MRSYWTLTFPPIILISIRDTVQMLIDLVYSDCALLSTSILDHIIQNIRIVGCVPGYQFGFFAVRMESQCLNIQLSQCRLFDPVRVAFSVQLWQE